MPVGTRVDWQPPQTLNGHTLVETKGADSTVGFGGLTITYVYKENEEQPMPPAAKTYTVRYEWGEAPPDKLRPTDGRTYPSEQAARAAADQTFTSASTSNAGKGELAGLWTFSGWDDGTLEDAAVVFRGGWTFTQSTPAVTVAAAPGLPFAVQVSGGRTGAATVIVAQYVGGRMTDVCVLENISLPAGGRYPVTLPERSGAVYSAFVLSADETPLCTRQALRRP